MQYRNMRIRYIVYQTPRHRLRSCCQSNTKTPAHIMLPCAVCHNVDTRHRKKTIKPSVESLLHPPDDVLASPLTTTATRMTKAKRARPTVRRKSESRRNVDVCPRTVPNRNLDTFRSRTSIWVLIFCLRAPQIVRRCLANFCLKKLSFNISCILNLSHWYVGIH